MKCGFHRPKCNIAGQATVEFAMTAVVFFLLTFSILNFAMAIYAYNLVSYAAREGTRYAAVRGSSSPAPVAASDVASFVRGESSGLKAANMTVTTSWLPDNNPGSFVQVDVQYTFAFTMPFVSLPTVTMDSTSQLVITQ